MPCSMFPSKSSLNMHTKCEENSSNTNKLQRLLITKHAMALRKSFIRFDSHFGSFVTSMIGTLKPVQKRRNGISQFLE